MPIDTTQPPGRMFAKLLKQLGESQARYQLLDDYYRGDPPLPWGPENSRDTFRRFQAKARANWPRMIVEAVRERQMVTGFRTGAEGDAVDDVAARQIWQANSLDADQALVHRAKLTMGDAYVIVGGIDSTTGVPRITPEDPRQVTVAVDPADRRKTIGALKVFQDDDADHAYLYLPGVVYKAARKRSGASDQTDYDAASWEPVGPPQQLPYAVVPVVRFGNRCDMFGRSMGEFEDVLDDVDRINMMLLQRLTVAVLQAFKQRAIKGLPKQDETGQDIDYSGDFLAGAGELWSLPEAADMWESGSVDLTPLLESVKADVRDLAAITETPLYRLTPDAAAGSAEGASLMREGLVFKTKDRNAETGESWEQVMSLAFLFAGDVQRASRVDMEVLWEPPERFSLAERYDAASKAQAAGVPWRTVMEDVLQFSPQQVDRMEPLRMADAFAQRAAAITTP